MTWKYFFDEVVPGVALIICFLLVFGGLAIVIFFTPWWIGAIMFSFGMICTFIGSEVWGR